MKVVPDLANVIVRFVDGQLARADRVVGGRISGVLEVGAVRARAFAATSRD